MLTLDDAGSLVHRIRRVTDSEVIRFDRLYGYAHGLLGTPDVPEGSRDEIKELAKLARKNIISLVIDSFAQNLSVVGYRHADAADDVEAWQLWQRQRMDARQAEIHRSALVYGAAYLTITPDAADRQVWRPRSPRQLTAIYEDPQVDAWPQYALEVWRDDTDAKPTVRGLLLDDEYVYQLSFGSLPLTSHDPRNRDIARLARDGRFEIGATIKHGATADGEAVCPVIRFVNDRDADDRIIGETEPLITPQQAINEVNFDRLIVARFGAFPQKVISGWTSTPDEVLKASASRVWTFGDPEVSASSFPAASLEPYNSLLAEMMEHVATVAQISPSQVTGKMVNLSAEALAAGEANQQRKILTKRESFGESWEQALKLGADLEGVGVGIDEGAEVMWRDTEARSFGAVVDGVTKLASAGIPIDALLSMVPGLSGQQIQAIRERLQTSGEIVSALQRLAQTRNEPSSNDGQNDDQNDDQVDDEQGDDGDDFGRG